LTPYKTCKDWLITSTTETQKFDIIKRATGQIATRTLLDKQFMVNTLQVLGQDPNSAPDDLLVYNSNITFVAKLGALRYLLDYDIPVDSLTLSFANPKVLGLDERDERKMRTFTFQVPVLAIKLASVLN